ncbi:MAG: hypothetical protein J6S23_05480 [Clostridia bacterium]|nr:hypothetical protein [Clostridia bacterium]
MDSLIDIKSSLSDMFEEIDTRNYYLADWKYEKIKEEIEQFQTNLSDEMDVGVALASFGTNMIMQVIDIEYQNPDLLYFHGYINGNRAELIQHVSQLNFVLMAIKKDDPKRPARRIGFITDDEV